MKRLLFVIMIISVSYLNAELAKGIELSPKLGYILSQHYGTKDQADSYSVKTGIRNGIVAGLDFRLPISDRLSLQYEFCYANRGSTQEIKVLKLDNEVLPKPAEMNVKYYLDYIDFPVLCNYKVFSSDKLSLSVVSGISMALKVNGKYELDGFVYLPDSGGYSEIPIHDKSKLKDVNMFDFGMIYGGELAFFIRKLPLIASYRFTIGWDYIALPTYESGNFAPVDLRNQSYSLALSIPFNLTD
jgi:hypothetical protein